MRYEGLLYRALNPLWAREPMSGEGARRYGGRFNRIGRPALYTALSIQTAIREANQIGALQPTVLVAYRADLKPIFDAADPELTRRHGLTRADLAAPDWRIRMREEGVAPTQRLAERLIAEGYVGLCVPSFAPGATAADLNLVLWRWGTEAPALLHLVDDEGRLG